MSTIQIDNTRKILVIGSSGAGKSTFARRLGKIINLDVVHLDSIYWKPGWVRPPEQEWKQTLEHAIMRDSWIIDGNYAKTFDLRFEVCDGVVFLDIARLVCLWRVTKRALQYQNKGRPDMAEGCPEKLNLDFMRWIWNYGKTFRPKVVRLLEQNSHNKKVVWLRSDAQVEAFLGNLQISKG